MRDGQRVTGDERHVVGANNDSPLHDHDIFIPGGGTHRHEHLSWKCGRPRVKTPLAVRAQRAPVPATPARCSTLAGKVRRVFWRMSETLVWMCRASLGWTN